jgi:hypothetical protein
MALNTLYSGQQYQDGIINVDDCAREAYALLPELLEDSVTVDGLQALLMLVSSLVYVMMMLLPGIIIDTFIDSASSAILQWVIWSV